MFPFPIIKPAVSSPASVSFCTSSTSGSNSSSYTFSGLSIGTAAADRKVVVTVTGDSGSATVSSLTVGGNSASLIKRQQVSGTPYDTVEIWALSLASGTTGDVVVNWSATQDRCGVGVFAIYGAAASSYATNGATNTSGSAVTATLDIPAGGVAVAVATGAAGSASSWTWTNLTEAYDATVESPSTHTGASAAFATAQSSLSITATPSAGNTRITMACASWGTP